MKGLSRSLALMKTVPAVGSICPAAVCALAKASPKLSATPITSPVDFISGPEHGIDAGELAPGKDGRLHEVKVAGIEVAGALDVLRQEFAQLAAGHKARGDLGQRNAGRLRDVRHGARGARVHLDDEHLVALDGVLHVHQADDFQRARQAEGVVANRARNCGAGISTAGSTQDESPE